MLICKPVIRHIASHAVQKRARCSSAIAVKRSLRDIRMKVEGKEKTRETCIVDDKK